MGSNPRTSETEAIKRQTQLDEKFPELKTYLNFDAPNWKLYAGDFLTKEEATLFRLQILKSCPEFGKETYVVSDKINVPVQITE